jgi:hypothetical protein
MTIALNRREFLEIWGGPSALIGLEPQYASGPIFVAEQFLLENGHQLERLHTYLREALAPALARQTARRQIVLEAIVSAHQPQVLFLQEFASVEAWREVTAALNRDSALLDAHREFDRENPYLTRNLSLYAATNYQPEPTILAASPQRIFELRTYQAPSIWQANGLHERFSGPEIPIFHRLGIHPVLYLSGLAGPQLPNLTYLTPFDSLAAREAAWSQFQADPEWHAARRHSIEQHGFTPKVITISLYKPAPYSPLR